MSFNPKQIILLAEAMDRSINRIKTQDDFDKVTYWYKKRGVGTPKRGSLSDIGYIVDNRVAGFLYITPSNVAFLDGFVSDPDTVPELRRESLVKLAGFLIDLATSMGYTTIIALTQHPGVKQLCNKFGFKKTSYECFMLKDEFGFIEDENSADE